MTDRRLWRGAAIIAALAFAGVALYLSPLRQMIDARSLLAAARASRDAWWSIPAFFVIYAIFDVLFIPTQALGVVAVLVWGWLRGATIELFAATFGAIFPFLIARGALREPIAARLAKHASMARILEREGFTLLLVLRVVPILPYTLLNYVAGLSSLRLWQYVVATLIGMIPSAYIFGYFVDALVQGVMEPREVLLRALAAGVLFAILIVATRLAAPRVRRRLASRDHTASPPAGGDRG
ncbi:MAG TPA: VTT domain-containing protein [Thermoanaerobaculia bacterium]|nr:VTT domain-containing protein [Thermoanaerobaculia bacterium]